MEYKRLNLGCGTELLDGYLNIDKERLFYQDNFMCLSLGNCTLPFENNSIEQVVSSHFLEHLDGEEIQHLIKELYRVCENGAIITFLCPYYKSPTAYRPFHQQYISETFFDDYKKMDPKKCKSADHKHWFKITYDLFDDVVVLYLEVVKEK